jgi:hypothetical protein
MGKPRVEEVENVLGLAVGRIIPRAQFNQKAQYGQIKVLLTFISNINSI